MHFKIVVFISLLVTLGQAYGQTVPQLKQALKNCEKDLNTSLDKIEQLETALQQTMHVNDRRKALSDSLIRNLHHQIRLQAAINMRLNANADTLQTMVHAYRDKLDKLAELYRQELQKKVRPWFFSWNGLQGFATGVLVGGALGLVFGLSR